MDPHRTRVKIGELLDSRCAKCFYNHEKRTYCRTCPTYSELRQLGDSLIRKGRLSRGREIADLLQADRVLSVWDVIRLIELGAERKDIAKALKMSLNDLRRYEELRVAPLLAAKEAKQKGVI